MSNWSILVNFLWADCRHKFFHQLVGHHLFHLPWVSRILDFYATVNSHMTPNMIAALHDKVQSFKESTHPLPAVSWFVLGRLDGAATTVLFLHLLSKLALCLSLTDCRLCLILSICWLFGRRISDSAGNVLRGLLLMKSFEGDKYTSSWCSPTIKNSKLLIHCLSL